MRRDRLTFAMMVGIPMLQLILFGFAINTDPKALPTAVRGCRHQRRIARTLRARAAEQRLLPHRAQAASEAEADRAAGSRRGAVRRRRSRRISRGACMRGERPALLVEADATDPAATGNALAALQHARPARRSKRDLIGPLRALHAGRPPFEVRVHRRYNPEGVTQYNIVPGLMGVDADDDHGDDDRASRSRASASAARWKICSPRRCGRSR